MSRILVSLLATLVFLMPPSSLSGEVLRDSQRGVPELTVVRGRAVCLDVSGHEVGSLFDCPENSGFGFVSKDGRVYRFLPADAMTPVFTDNRVRQRELQITARSRTRDELEIIKVQSIKAGKLYDIFYYCDVCSITGYVPGHCPCCRNELEFMETPH